MPRRIAAPSPTLLALPAALALPCGQAWALALLPALFAAVVALDLLRPGGASREEQDDSRLAGLALWLWPAAQTTLLGAALLVLRHDAPGVAGWIGLTAGVGLAGGLIGMPAAHELMHRRSRTERALAEWLLVLCGYAHFRVEHVGGHHRAAGLPEDAATARAGESLYAFLVRALPAGAGHAWQLERHRLRRQGRAPFGLHHRVLRGALLSALLAGAAGALAGAAGLLFFVAQALLAVGVLEAVNYVQHYGLRRRDAHDAPAWNSDTPAGNWLLLGLGRHSDHHRASHRPYPQLRWRPSTPQLPTGLPGMVLLALLPPLWFGVMDPLARHWRDAEQVQ